MNARALVMGATSYGDDHNAPAIITRSAADVDAALWTESHRGEIHTLLDRRKAVLLRGFGIDAVGRFQKVLAALGADLIEYSERSTPRSTVDGRVYTSTEYPNTGEIPMHNENSYSWSWPRRVHFCCLQPAASGGATPIADSRAVYAAIEPSIRRTFVEKKVMYVRNYGQGVDLTWQEAFQTDDRHKVEAYCRNARITFEWFDRGECLHTEQIRPAALRHTATGECVWFNQAHLFHVSSLDPALREALCGVFPPSRLPRHACYGDGTEITDDVLNEIRNVYRRMRLLIEWQRGDLLLLDNLFYAHGRLPFTGRRNVIVAMDTPGGSGTEPL